MTSKIIWSIIITALSIKRNMKNWRLKRNVITWYLFTLFFRHWIYKTIHLIDLMKWRSSIKIWELMDKRRKLKSRLSFIIKSLRRLRRFFERNYLLLTISFNFRCWNFAVFMLFKFCLFGFTSNFTIQFINFVHLISFFFAFLI